MPSHPPHHVALHVRAGDELVVEAAAVRIGEDLLVWIWGGDRPHLGAVAAAHPRPSRLDPTRTSATASVLTFSGHQEDAVVKRVSERLAAALGVHVVVTAGLHWEGLSPEDIDRVLAAVEEVAREILKRLETVDPP